MAIPGKIVVYGPDRRFLPGSISVPDDDIKGLTGSEILEFDHRVWSNLREKHLLNTWYDVRKHGPLRIVKPIDKLSVLLYKYCLRCEFLPQVEIRWYKHMKGVALPVEYFRHTLEHVRVKGIRSILHNVKDFSMEKLDASEEVTFAYQRITWLYRKGYLLFMDEWKGGFYEESLMDFSKDKGNEDEDEIFVKSEPLPPLKITFTEGRFLKGEKGFVYGKPCKIWFKAVLSRKPDCSDEFKVDVKIYSDYKGKVKQIQMLLEERIRSDGIYEGTLNSFEKHPDASPYDLVEYYAVISSKYAESAFEGERIVMPEKKRIKVPWFIDCHMHVFSPQAAPLPVVWAVKGGAKLFISSWEKIEKQPVKTLLKIFLHQYQEYATMTTEALGERVLGESEALLKDQSLDEYMGISQNRKRILIALGIDIEMAHYWGYEGKTVYQQNENGQMGYFSYEKPGKREWCEISSNETKKILTFYKQLRSTKSVLKNSKGKLLAFFPFDPRHWLGKLSTISLGTWQETLDFLIQTSNNIKKLNRCTYVGYKLYTALGFRPDDYKSNYVISKGTIPQKKSICAKLPDLKEFYSVCMSNCIPIICHCSNGGIFAYDYTLYYDYIFGGDDAGDQDKKEFFYEYYVSPFAWERVLEDFPELHLCLAHFGGEEEWENNENTPMPWAEKCAELVTKYPNFYVDLAYFTFKEESVKNKFKKLISKYPKLKEKIIFGTDWYLIGGEREKFGRYETYFKRSINILSEIDSELPAYSMAINPKRFLKLELVSEKLFKTFGSEYSDLLQLAKEEIPNDIKGFII